MFSDDKGLKCLVKHDNIDSIIQKNGESINPNNYELLNNLQAQVLISASQVDTSKATEEEGVKRIMAINRHNQKIQNAPYEKYGGSWNLMMYMNNNKPEKENSKPLERKVYRSESGNLTGAAAIPLIDEFENDYSIEQQNELIESVKKNTKQPQTKFIAR